MRDGRRQREKLQVVSGESSERKENLIPRFSEIFVEKIYHADEFWRSILMERCPGIGRFTC